MRFPVHVILGAEAAFASTIVLKTSRRMQTNVKCLDIAYRNSRYDMLDRTGSDLSAIAMNGKRSVKSFPARVISRTPAASLRARMRKPSCLISVEPAKAGRRSLGRRGQAKARCSPSRGGYAHATTWRLIGMKGERVESLCAFAHG